MGVTVFDNQVVKSIGASGQISLGKEHAGRKVLIETPEPGV
jgi:putative transposon-encoded protein